MLRQVIFFQHQQGLVSIVRPGPQSAAPNTSAPLASAHISNNNVASRTSTPHMPLSSSVPASFRPPQSNQINSAKTAWGGHATGSISRMQHGSGTQWPAMLTPNGQAAKPAQVANSPHSVNATTSNLYNHSRQQPSIVSQALAHSASPFQNNSQLRSKTASPHAPSGHSTGSYLKDSYSTGRGMSERAAEISESAPLPTSRATFFPHDRTSDWPNTTRHSSLGPQRPTNSTSHLSYYLQGGDPQPASLPVASATPAAAWSWEAESASRNTSAMYASASGNSNPAVTSQTPYQNHVEYSSENLQGVRVQNQESFGPMPQHSFSQSQTQSQHSAPKPVSSMLRQPLNAPKAAAWYRHQIFLEEIAKEKANTGDWSQVQFALQGLQQAGYSLEDIEQVKRKALFIMVVSSNSFEAGPKS